MSDFPEVETSFKDYSWLVSGNVVLVVLSILYMSLLTRILGPDGYGILSIFLLVVQGLFTFFINWTGAAVIRYGREEFMTMEKISRVFWGRSFIITIGLVIAGVLLFLLRQRLSGYIGIPPGKLWLVFATVVALTLLSFTQYIFQTIRMIKHYTVSQVLEKLMQVAVLGLIFVGGWSKTIIPVVTLLAVATFLTAVWCIFCFDLRIFSPLTFDFTIVKKIFFFSYPVIIGSLSAYVVNWIDIIVIRKYMTMADVGIYAVAYRGMSLILQAGLLTNVVLGPLLISFVVSKRNDLVERYVNRIVPQALALWVGLLLVCLLLAHLAVPVLFGDRFIPLLPSFSLLLLGLAFNGTAMFYSPVFTAYELIKQSAFINVLMALVNLVADFMFVPVFGLKGAALATTVAMGMSAALFFVMVGKNFKVWNKTISLIIMPLFLAVGWLLIRSSLWHYFLSCFLGLWLLHLVVRKMMLFSPDDWSIIEKIDMPAWLKNILCRYLYRKGS